MGKIRVGKADVKIDAPTHVRGSTKATRILTTSNPAIMKMAPLMRGA